MGQEMILRAWGGLMSQPTCPFLRNEFLDHFLFLFVCSFFPALLRYN